MALVGALALGVGVGVMVSAGDRGASVPASDGLGTFAVVQGGGLVTEWGEIRVTAAKRSFALLNPTTAQRPQMLVFPHAAAWPALAVPSGWRVAWVDAQGRILEVQTGDGHPLVAKDASQAGAARVLFSAPASGLGGALSAGGRLLWSDAMPMSQRTGD